MIDLLIEHIQEKKNPTVMGLDPRMDLIPEAIRNKAYEQYGKTPRGAAEALFLFNEALIEATFDLLPSFAGIGFGFFPKSFRNLSGFFPIIIRYSFLRSFPPHGIIKLTNTIESMIQQYQINRERRWLR